MGWHRFLMKHGIGSPGYIARRMARHYRAAKEARPNWIEHEVLNAVYAMRVAAQSVLGGPVEYQMTKKDPSLKDAALDKNPDLFSIIRHAIIIEHPELQNPYAPPDRFEVLDSVISEILDQETPGWRNVAAKSVPSPPGHMPGSADFQPRFSLTEEERLQVGITYFVAGRRFDASAWRWRPVPRASLYSECEAEDCVLTAVKRLHESSVPRRNLVRHFFLPIQLLLMAQRRGDFLTIQQEPAFSRAGKSNFGDLYDAYAFGSGGEAAFHQEWTRIRVRFGESPEESEDIVTFSGGPGLTKETALRIDPMPDRILANRREAEPILVGEYWYLAYNHGRMGIDWVRESQMLLQRDEAGKMYDCLNVKFKDGRLHQIYFDISHLPY
jgi:hypothetical protein